MGLSVPEVLLNGNHKEIEKWKREKQLEETKKYRPDLLEGDK
jgi:tRNA (guanine37-N1)-methyltransferase